MKFSSSSVLTVERNLFLSAGKESGCVDFWNLGRFEKLTHVTDESSPSSHDYFFDPCGGVDDVVMLPGSKSDADIIAVRSWESRRSGNLCI